MNRSALPLVVEAFAGAGGMSEALRIAAPDFDVVGIELDPDACATARLAGHSRLQLDVTRLDLGRFRDRRVVGFVAGPPCQSYSPAGKQLGQLDRPRIERHIRRVRAAGRWVPYRRGGWHDPRSPMVLEVLRYALALEPEWILLEQVPPVLPLWLLIAEVLRDHGWSVDTGVLSAEQYGVPQTRRRAFLLASRRVRAVLPRPTHRAYRKGTPQWAGDPALLPWVSMADALEWWSPDDLIGFARLNDRPTGGRYRDRDLRPADGPAQTVPEKVRSWVRFGSQANSPARGVDEPASTITGSRDFGGRVWVRSTLGEPHVDGRNGTHEFDPFGRPSHTVTTKAGEWAVRFGNQPNSALRGADQPAATLHFGHRLNSGVDWVRDRPATTVQGDARIWPPGHKVNGADRRRLGASEADERYGDRAGADAVRVSVQEAAVLQAFRWDYPWQGPPTAQYRQVGDAAPPQLVAAVVRQVVEA